MSNPIEEYLKELHQIRSTGAAVAETSYYPALRDLLNAVGKSLKPKVRCIITPKNQGAGIPDGGLFTPDQFQKSSAAEPLPGQKPSRGAIEAKPTNANVTATANSKQVRDYLQAYGQVLVTNFRDFLLVGKGESNTPSILESYHLADSEAAFWAAAAHPQKMAQEHSERLTQYLTRVMLHATQLVSPEDVAWFLASYARDAKARIEHIELPALDAVRAALEEALGLKFEGEKGDHFFRSTLVQTLFYGIFSAWVLWSKQHPPAGSKPAGGSPKFNWHEAAWSLHVPMIRTLFEQIATPTTLGPLDLVEVLDWTGAALNRVDRAAFFESFEEGHAVQYFYEPFLQAFDPELRKELGVWYTPPEIIQYMVARVDTVLREELGLPDGLADPNVYILDPCCGTGAYLVEVLKRIAQTMREKGGDALLSNDIKQAAMTRVFGFELLPAPFVVSHLQLGLLLQNLGAPLSDTERAGVYLTNALTGWEPPKEPKHQIALLELEAEREAADKVKRETPILVILGNPPYNAFAGVSPKEEMGLIEPYKEGLRTKWGILAGSMHDLYVRFFRLAEKHIAEINGKGIVCYISNHSWVSEPSFVVLREHLFNSFDCFWIDNLHGNRKISEYAPDGRTSETIFAIPGFSVGIQQGVVISLWARSAKRGGEPKVFFRDDINAAKAAERRSQLLESLRADNFNSQYEIASPNASNRFSFLPADVATFYLQWPSLTDLSFVGSFPGMDEDRRFALISDQKQVLEERMSAFLNPLVAWDQAQQLHEGFRITNKSFDGDKIRKKLFEEKAEKKEEAYKQSNIKRYVSRPFDIRWCYYESSSGLWHRAVPEREKQTWDGNYFIISRPAGKANPEGVCFYFTSFLTARDMLMGHANCIPMQLRLEKNKKIKGKELQTSFFSNDSEQKQITISNLSPGAHDYLRSIGVLKQVLDHKSGNLIWMHALATGYSPAYLTENADGIRQDWPRIPLPNDKELLLASAGLGRQVAALLDTENPVAGVTSGTIRPELKAIANIAKVQHGDPAAALRVNSPTTKERTGGKLLSNAAQSLSTLDPQAGDLAVTAGWGHAGKGGVTMPAKGKIVRREYTAEELAAFKEATAGGARRPRPTTDSRSVEVSDVGRGFHPPPKAAEGSPQPLHEEESLASETIIARLGETTCDIYLNGVAYWKNVPEKIWQYTIGGYQVMKKWLSYREKELLGRDLRPEEVREVTNMARRIAAILLLEPALDTNYQAVKANTYPWPG